LRSIHTTTRRRTLIRTKRLYVDTVLSIPVEALIQRWA
jgi:hypothetical protein